MSYRPKSEREMETRMLAWREEMRAQGKTVASAQEFDSLQDVDLLIRLAARRLEFKFRNPALWETLRRALEESGEVLNRMVTTREFFTREAAGPPPENVIDFAAETARRKHGASYNSRNPGPRPGPKAG